MSKSTGYIGIDPEELMAKQAHYNAEREMTVEDVLNQRAALLERCLRNVRAVKGGMSQDFLRSPASNIREM